MRSILITQCVQNDFLRPLGPTEPLPNLVHIGRLEAERLNAPLTEFLTLAHGVDPEKLAIVHIGDQHDPQKHAEHLRHFRPHCIAGTPGAQALDPVPLLAKRRRRTYDIQAGDLTDLEDTALLELLKDLTGDDQDIRIAVVGVWTDAKVSFLLYDLCTRLRIRQLATCSALTASRSIEAHFRALESLSDLLNVTVFHSGGELLKWLVPNLAPLRPAQKPVKITFAKPPQLPARWTREDENSSNALISRLYATGNPVPAQGTENKDEWPGLQLQQLGGGFSGAQVFIGTSKAEPPRIYKVGPRDEIARERFGNERIRRVLGDAVPRLLAWQEGPALAAMKLELAEGNRADLKGPLTFKALYEGDLSETTTEVLQSTLEFTLSSALGRFYRTAEKDNADLLELYGFTDRQGRPQFAESIARKCEAIAVNAKFSGAAAMLKKWKLPEPWMPPEIFYTQWLPGQSVTREILPSLVHGDLNLANMLLTYAPGSRSPERVWIIDFARLGRLPNLTDFAKIENDLTYIAQPVRDLPGLEQAQKLQEERLASPTLAVPGLMEKARTPQQVRYARLIFTLRALAARMDPRGKLAMSEYRIALLRYAAHTLGFDEPNPFQLRLALTGCAQLCGYIARDFS
ncbi:MAG TPA: hypothetical protein VEK08_04360 [Planctomycetota bacterium]|nr:hypothetical protein [Planctomycetota bacterium]